MEKKKKKGIHWRVRGINKTQQKATGEVDGEFCLAGRTFELYSGILGLSSASAVCTLYDSASYLIL